MKKEHAKPREKKVFKDCIMCKRLKELNGLSAEQILEIYGDDSIPVDIKRVLDKLKVSYSPMDFGPVEESVKDIVDKRGHILGAAMVFGDEINIFYSEKDSSENRIRFTLAHELAHCCLNAASLENDGHIEFRFDEKSQAPAEVAANIFAGKLLIPKNALLRIYHSMIAPLSDVLAKEFGVSVNVMEERLKYLDLPFYSPNYG